MTETPSKSSPLPTVEEGLNAMFCNAEKSIRHRYQECEQSVRKSPTTSVLAAVAAGYCLHRLPVRAILVAQVRLLSALAPPALFLFGAAKVFEFLQTQESARHQ